MAPITLQITFTGLCMYVRPRQGSADPLHVLLLGHHHEPHEAHLIYDEAYEAGTATERSGRLKCVTLKNAVLDLSGLGPGGSRPDASGLWENSGQLADMRLYELGPLDPGQVGDSPSSDVVGRVTTSVGRYAGSVPGSLWHIEHKGNVARRQVTTGVVWSIDEVPADQIDRWKLIPLRPHAELERLPTLRPIKDGTDTVEVFVFNVPPGELPHPGNRIQRARKGEPAKHFDAYFNLWPHVVQSTPVRTVPRVAVVGPQIPYGPNPVVNLDCKHTSSAQPSMAREGGMPRPRSPFTERCIGARTSLD